MSHFHQSPLSTQNEIAVALSNSRAKLDVLIAKQRKRKIPKYHRDSFSFHSMRFVIMFYCIIIICLPFFIFPFSFFQVSRGMKIERELIELVSDQLYTHVHRTRAQYCSWSLVSSVNIDSILMRDCIDYNNDDIRHNYRRQSFEAIKMK